MAWVSQTFFQNNVYRVRHGLIKGLLRKGGLGFLPEALSGSTENEETRFWRALDLSGRVVYDIGAFHGLLTCFFARQAKQVVAFEPTPANHQRLLENLGLNGFTNVEVRHLALGAEPGAITIVWDPRMPGGASAESNLQHQMEHQAGVRKHTVPMSTLDTEAASLPAPDFIKIDVEGFELPVLEGARGVLAQHRPTLFLEMHGDTMKAKREKVAALVHFLEQAGYRNIEHVQTGTKIESTNSAVAAEGHLYCRWS